MILLKDELEKPVGIISGLDYSKPRLISYLSLFTEAEEQADGYQGSHHLKASIDLVYVESYQLLDFSFLNPFLTKH